MRPLRREVYRELVRAALAEDIGSGDVTTDATVLPGQRAHGVFVAKADGILAGIDVAFETFRQLEPGVEVASSRQDGDRISDGEEFAEISGRARTLLLAERSALNLLQRLCGIATLTRRFVDAAAGRIVVLDTRKTTPLLRSLEKYAVSVGGATNHRMGLFDAFLIKDNHVRLAGGICAAVSRARSHRPDLPIEIEVQTVEEVDQAVEAGADIVLIDNMALGDIAESVRRVAGRAAVEISGGVTLERMPELAATGADRVSVGALTHSAPVLDISFEVEPL
jgi:nicotinate-nucleotide pyrophosphorylase (carboxylating)